MFSTHLENFLPSSSNLKLLFANSLSLEESKICRLGKGQELLKKKKTTLQSKKKNCIKDDGKRSKQMLFKKKKLLSHNVF